MQQLTHQQAMRYNRQISLKDVDLEGQERWLNARVLLIGVGGLGCSAAQSLVGAGIGELTLVDDDVVELSNLHRQVLHYEPDVGRHKVDSARETLLQINGQCRIHSIHFRLSEQQLCAEVKKADIVLDCCDNLNTRNLINKVCWQQKTPLVSGAAIRLEGQVCCFQNGPELPCYECFSALFPEQSLSCAEAGVLPPVVAIIGAMQAMETLKMLLGLGQSPLGKMLLFDFKSCDWRTFTVPKNPTCAVCGN
ncbi:HesA/MoeB/ThiF family protein [Planctobacterium marinum]|uniref:HesA/MoeB/ThiF family protein n=1 Tax=Planctobacterium marinum TaxID=1631968 RepID=UPI001E4401C7|nr:molybdopterin-synthase adenylyltransferase MoeB [Planctobacterium marinum]